jgi:hypothetical protein
MQAPSTTPAGGCSSGAAARRAATAPKTSAPPTTRTAGYPGWGPYEHLPPDQWEGDCIGEGYRRCCTSKAWIGQALAARLVSAQQNWSHDAFFAYADRWMDPTGDAEYTQTIYEMTGRDFRSSWAAHGHSWDDFVDDMWELYRR